MKRVPAYQSTDGRVFADKAICKTHQTGLNVVHGVRALVGSKMEAPEVFQDAVVMFLLNNREAALIALSGKVDAPEEQDATESEVDPVEPVVAAEEELEDVLDGLAELV